jgi:hypothetical protein
MLKAWEGSPVRRPRTRRRRGARSIVWVLVVFLVASMMAYFGALAAALVR